MREFYAYVWQSSASRQIVLIILAIMAALLAAAPLELQRHIINTLAGHEKAEHLAWLCGGYLVAALGIGGLKYTVNIKSAGLGEAMIRSLREDIVRSSSPVRPDETLEETDEAQIGDVRYHDLHPGGSGREVCRRLHFDPNRAGGNLAQRV